ncbi:hypothetical protein ATANTOWER_001757 [Ataeniobius toweri]|uniref:Uncharacterized protein n=1 Tax=Ataeniobius toweri TaxID=208326 RepID=A0ABU7BSX6_9TELE|nr:hypothetical protein [Ataeniobius toweri]
MLAIAKISAARNRHPEMIVSLSMSPGEEVVSDGGKWGGGCPNLTPLPGCSERLGVGCYLSNLAPFNSSLLLRFCCAFCSNVSPFASSKSEPPATKGSDMTHKSITSQKPRCTPVMQNKGSLGAEAPDFLRCGTDPLRSSRCSSSSIGYSFG